MRASVRISSTALQRVKAVGGRLREIGAAPETRRGIVAEKSDENPGPQIRTSSDGGKSGGVERARLEEEAGIGAGPGWEQSGAGAGDGAGTGTGTGRGWETE